MVKIFQKLVKFCHFCFFSKTLLNFYVTWTLNIHQKKFWIFLVIFGNNPRGKTQLSFFTLFFFKRLYFRPEVQSAKILGRPDQQIRMFLTKKNFGVVPQILTIIWGVHQWCTPSSDVFDYTMYVNKETDHDVWKFMMYVDDGSMMDVDTSCMKSMDLYMMYPHPSWIHRRDTSCNQIHRIRVYTIDLKLLCPDGLR